MGEVRNHVRVAVLGAGFGGLGVAAQLARRGQRDVVLFEKNDGVGGTWWENSYPGCACDIPSLLYSFSFAPKHDWSRSYSPQAEIQAYLEEVVDRFALRPQIRFGTRVLGAQWDADALVWRISTSAGDWTADVFVVAHGALSDPSIPDINGLSSFEGEVFHSARWRHDLDLAGKDVAVVGTGASAIQFVPFVAEQARSLTLLQRTPPWVMPRRDKERSERMKRLNQRFPAFQRAQRSAIWASQEILVVGMRHPKLQGLLEAVGRKHIEMTVPDPELRARLTPSYRLGCKRILRSSDYLPALARDDVEVVDGGLVEVRPHGVVGGDGVERRADVIIFGTGFHVTDPPIFNDIRDSEGRSLAEHWQGSPKAYLGSTVAGYPNLFVILGPNTGLGHNSVVLMAEAQMQQLLALIDLLDRTGAAAFEPTQAAQQAWVDEVERKMRGTVWVDGGCRSWYLDTTGRNSTLWPGFTFAFHRRLGRLDPAAYVMHRRSSERTLAVA